MKETNCFRSTRQSLAKCKTMSQRGALSDSSRTMRRARAMLLGLMVGRLLIPKKILWKTTCLIHTKRGSLWKSLEMDSTNID